MTASMQQRQVAELAEVFHLMGDPSRLSILMVVLDGPLAVAEIARRLPDAAEWITQRRKDAKAA